MMKPKGRYVTSQPNPVITALHVRDDTKQKAPTFPGAKQEFSLPYGTAVSLCQTWY